MTVLKEFLNSLSLLGAPTILGGFVLAVLLYSSWRVIYNLYFHPLSKYPGPKLFAASIIPNLWYFTQGRLIYKLKQLHDCYGDVVRVAPDELAFIGKEAQKDIYAFGSGKGPLPKSRDFYGQLNGADSIVTTPSNAEHAKIRKRFNPGFSERAMREQQDTIMGYINTFIQKLSERHAHGPQDLSKWFNLITFDIIGDLAFGESFGSVESGDYHPWILAMVKNNIWMLLAVSSARFPPLKVLLALMMPKTIIQERANMLRYTKEKVARRLPFGDTRSDFMSPLLRDDENKGCAFSLPELEANAMILVVAGSETTASLLSGVTYYLLTNPHVLDKLTHEIRCAFKSSDDINLLSVNSLKYELAVLDEGLRLFPPASAGVPRRVPSTGTRIGGHWVPGGTRVSTSPWASYRSGKRFYLPESFIPERWLGGDERFDKDDRRIVTPFSTGPRNCIGMNLAYAEMRTIIAKLLWNFDLKLMPQSYDWLSTARKYLSWHREPLLVEIHHRAGNET